MSHLARRSLPLRLLCGGLHGGRPTWRPSAAAGWAADPGPQQWQSLRRTPQGLPAGWSSDPLLRAPPAQNRGRALCTRPVVSPTTPWSPSCNPEPSARSRSGKQGRADREAASTSSVWFPWGHCVGPEVEEERVRSQGLVLPWVPWRERVLGSRRDRGWGRQEQTEHPPHRDRVWKPSPPPVRYLMASLSPNPTCALELPEVPPHLLQHPARCPPPAAPSAGPCFQPESFSPVPASSLVEEGTGKGAHSVGHGGMSGLSWDLALGQVHRSRGVTGSHPEWAPSPCGPGPAACSLTPLPQVTGGLFSFHFLVHLIAVSIDPAEANVRLKKNYLEPMPTFDRSKHAHVIQKQYCHLCEVTV